LIEICRAFFEFNTTKVEKTINNQRDIARILLPVFYMLGWLFLYYVPRKFYYIAGIQGFLIGLIIFLILPILLYLSLRKNNISINWSKGLAYGSMLLVIPFYLLISKEDSRELENYKKETISTVSGTWIITDKKRKDTRMVSAKYKVNNQTYKVEEEDNMHRLTIGDTVTIIYSSKTPEISKIKELD